MTNGPRVSVAYESEGLILAHGTHYTALPGWLYLCSTLVYSGIQASTRNIASPMAEGKGIWLITHWLPSFCSEMMFTVPAHLSLARAGHMATPDVDGTDKHDGPQRGAVDMFGQYDSYRTVKHISISILPFKN